MGDVLAAGLQVAEIAAPAEQVREIWEAGARFSALLSNCAIQDTSAQNIIGLDESWGSAAFLATAIAASVLSRGVRVSSIGPCRPRSTPTEKPPPLPHEVPVHKDRFPVFWGLTDPIAVAVITTLGIPSSLVHGRSQTRNFFVVPMVQVPKNHTLPEPVLRSFLSTA